MLESGGSGLEILMRMNLSTIEKGSESKGSEVGEVGNMEKVGKLIGVNEKTEVML